MRAHLLGLVQRIRTMAPGRSTLLRNGSMASRLGSSTGESAMAGTRIASKSRWVGRRTGVRHSRIKKRKKIWRVKKAKGGRRRGYLWDPPSRALFRLGQGLLCGAGVGPAGWGLGRAGVVPAGPDVSEGRRLACGRGALVEIRVASRDRLRGGEDVAETSSRWIG